MQRKCNNRKGDASYCNICVRYTNYRRTTVEILDDVLADYHLIDFVDARCHVCVAVAIVLEDCTGHVEFPRAH